MERLRRPEEPRDKTPLDEDGYVRLVQMTGRGSYVVSVPKSWIETAGLKKGGRVEFSKQQNEGLLLTPFDEHGAVDEISHCQISLDSDETPETAIRKIISLYLRGFSTIEVTSKSGTLSAAVRNEIRQVARQKLIGTEMITESSKSTTLQVLLDYPQLLAPDALRRMSSIMTSMVRDAVQALIANDKELALQVIRTDDEIDRFSLYIIRQIKWGIRHPPLEKIGIRSPPECLAYRVITANLERSADHASRVAKNTLVFHRPLDQVLARDITALARFSSDMMETALRALNISDYDIAESTFLESKNLAVLAARLIDRSSKKKMSAQELSALTLISESLRRIGEGAAAIAEIVLDLTAEKSIQPPVRIQ